MVVYSIVMLVFRVLGMQEEGPRWCLSPTQYDSADTSEIQLMGSATWVFLWSSPSASFCSFSCLYIHILTIYQVQTFLQSQLFFRHFVVPIQLIKTPICLCSPNLQKNHANLLGSHDIPIIWMNFQSCPIVLKRLTRPDVGFTLNFCPRILLQFGAFLLVATAQEHIQPQHNRNLYNHRNLELNGRGSGFELKTERDFSRIFFPDLLQWKNGCNSNGIVAFQIQPWFFIEPWDGPERHSSEDSVYVCFIVF